MVTTIDISYEQELLKTYPHILGIDEVGRGPLAGPVTMAGVIITDVADCIAGVNDSKKVPERKREVLAVMIKKTHPYHIVHIENTIIDTIGISKAIEQGMLEIINTLTSDIVLIDGYFKKDTFPPHTKTVIDGDAKHYSIAAASIIAKQARDNLMKEIDSIYPGYNFAKHKGYGTKEHIGKIKELGLSPIHRASFTRNIIS